MQIEIDQERLAKVTKLDSGKHDKRSEGMCVMEAVSWVARETWSDHPKCVCPVIGAFMRAWNDGLPDEERTAIILPLIPRLVGTRGSKALEERRALMAADWLVRTHTPAWLRLAGLTTQADALANLPEITSMAQVPSIKPAIEAAQRDAAAVRDAVWDAAWDAARAAAWDAARAAVWAAARAAAGDAAWDAVRDAAWDAVRDAAWDAARAAAGDAAWDAVRDAAWDAVRDAAWDAARAAVTAKLNPVRLELQKSALVLVERMTAASDDQNEKAA